MDDQLEITCLCKISVLMCHELVIYRYDFRD